MVFPYVRAHHRPNGEYAHLWLLQYDRVKKTLLKRNRPRSTVCHYTLRS